MKNTNWFKANTPFIMIPILASSMLLGCKRGENISLDGNYGQIGVNIADTFTVVASTFLLDPLPTAGTGSMLVGRILDEALGAISLSSYFTVSNATLASIDLPSQAAFDSLSLQLFYAGYHYGDTTKQIGLAVHRLSEAISLAELPVALEDDEYPVFVSGQTLWSNLEFEYGPTPIGQTRFSPKPNSQTDTIRIRMADLLGKELFELAKEKDVRLTDSDDFADYLKGFMLQASTDATCVLGLRDSLALNLHYSYERQSDGMRVSDTLTIGIGLASHRFNSVTTNRDATTVAGLSYAMPELPASQTGQRTFIQGSSGIVTRLRLPSIKEFVNNGSIAVSKAQLIIETDQREHSWFAPPKSLTLMAANQYGTPTSLLGASYADGTQIAYYQSPGQAGEAGNGTYTFNLTQYISELRNAEGNDKGSLLLTLPTDELMATVNRLSVASKNGKPAIKLHLIYVKL